MSMKGRSGVSVSGGRIVGTSYKCNVELGLAQQTFIHISVIPFNVRIIALQLSKIHCRGKNINH